MRDERTAGAILAGGLARRLGGGDKALRRVGSERVMDRLVARIAPQVAMLVLNANDDAGRFSDLALTVVPDSLPDRPGPLAGVLAVLDWAAASAPDCGWVLTVPGDAPFLPRDLAARLHAERAASGATLAYAMSGGRSHPVVALWPVSLRAALRHAVVVEGVRKVGAFTGGTVGVGVAWGTEPVDPFFNVNTPEDVAEANRLAAAHPDL